MCIFLVLNSCSTLGVACVLMSRPISPELVLSPDFWVSNISRYFSFAFGKQRIVKKNWSTVPQSPNTWMQWASLVRDFIRMIKVEAFHICSKILRPIHTREPINSRSLPLWKNGRIGKERALIGESVWWSKIQRGLSPHWGVVVSGISFQQVAKWSGMIPLSTSCMLSGGTAWWSAVQRRLITFWSGLVGDTA